jgi:hypothetical protein
MTMEKKVRGMERVILREGKELIRTFNGHYRRKSVKFLQSELILKKAHIRERSVPHLP